MTGTRRKLLKATIAIVALAIALITVRFWPRPPLSERISSSTAVLDAEGHLLRLTMAKDEQYRLWTPIDKVAPDFIAALLPKTTVRRNLSQLANNEVPVDI